MTACICINLLSFLCLTAYFRNINNNCFGSYSYYIFMLHPLSIIDIFS